MSSMAAAAIAEPRSAGRDDGRATAMAAQSRTLRNSVISLAVFFVIVAALLLGVPGLRSAAELITDADPLRWVAAAVGLELLSCVGYVVLFDLVFGHARPAPDLAPVAVGAGGQLGRLGQRPGRHRAGRLGAAQQGHLGASGSPSARC